LVLDGKIYRAFTLSITGSGFYMLFDLKICIVGLGYIGLPSAALLANRGYQVQGVDV
jgi:molybdopterin/thiamine biosynthesis adenylyltransferase